MQVDTQIHVTEVTNFGLALVGQRYQVCRANISGDPFSGWREMCKLVKITHCRVEDRMWQEEEDRLHDRKCHGNSRRNVKFADDLLNG